MKPKKYTGNLRVLHFAGNLQTDFFIMLRFYFIELSFTGKLHSDFVQFTCYSIIYCNDTPGNLTAILICTHSLCLFLYFTYYCHLLF